MAQCPLGQRLKVVFVTITSEQDFWHIGETQTYVLDWLMSDKRKRGKRRRKEGGNEGGFESDSWAGHFKSLDQCTWLPRSSFVCILQLFVTPALGP